MKKFLIATIIAFITIFSGTFGIKAEFRADKEWSVIKPGDIIYFDNSEYNWENVYIYLWQRVNHTDGDAYKPWNEAVQMTKVEGTENIYEFVVPDDIGEKYNMVIFKNGNSGSSNQTINLGFVEQGFVYIMKESVTSGSDYNKKVGYWYLYDNGSILEHLDDIQKYQEDKQYYTTDSYSNLDELITTAATEANSEIRLFSEQDANGNDTGKYYIQIDITFYEIQNIIDNLVVDTTLLEEKVSDEQDNMDDYEEMYTTSSLQGLKDEIDNANDVLNNPNITVDDIKNAIKAIDDAVDKLVEQADKTELNKVLEEIENINKDDYTSDSYENLINLVDTSKTIVDDKDANQTEVDEYVSKLKQGINSLVKKPVSDVQNNTSDNKSDNVSVNNNKRDTIVDSDNLNLTSNSDNPKTLDNIVTVISVLVIAIVILVILIVLRKKIKK